jgi:hypothetical protein
MKITLLQKKGKVDESRFLTALEHALVLLRGDLTVEMKLQPLTKHGWAILDLTGDDTEIFIELLSKKIGLAPLDFSKIEQHSNYRGIVKSFDADLIVDIGIERPEVKYVRVKLSSLRAQLADGKGWIPAREIQESYCLFPETPLSVRVTRCEHNESELEGWLSDKQISLFFDWIRCGLDRVQVYDCLKPRLDFAISKAKLERDTISIDQLNLTTHSVVCKLGTDAVGLIPRLGANLRRSELKPFIPHRIQEKCRGWLDGAR